MSGNPTRTRRFLIVGSILFAFVSGGALGAIGASAAAVRSVQSGLLAARGLFAYDQRERLALAWNAGDLNEALAYARCADEVEFSEGAGWFDPRAIRWSVWHGSPYQAILAASDAARAKTDEGLAQARIAVVLERLGRTEDAQERLAQAVKIGGRDVAWWRKAGLTMVGKTLPEGFAHPDRSARH